MLRFLTRKRIVRWFGVVMGLMIITLMIWMIITGLIAVFRVLRYGDTKIDDFTHYPGRKLRASSTSYSFNLNPNAFQVPSTALQAFGSNGQLDQKCRVMIVW